MNEKQFNFGIDKLREVYGEAKYPAARTSLLYEKFKNIPADVYLKGINNMVLSCKFAPLLAEFFDEFGSSMRIGGDIATPSRFNTDSGYKKTENGVSNKQVSRAIGDILKGIL